MTDLERRAQQAFEDAWLEPNREFIAETDAILASLGCEPDPPIMEHGNTIAIRTGVLDASSIIQTGAIRTSNIIAVSVGPGEEPKVTYSFNSHDQGEAVFQ